MFNEAPCLPLPAAHGHAGPAAPPGPSSGTAGVALAGAGTPRAVPATDPALRLLLDDATRRARFFQGPARWLRDHAPSDASLLEAYADALAHELAPSGHRRGQGSPGSPDAWRPGWLAHGVDADALAASPAPAKGAQEVRMAVAVVAAAASVVSAVAAVVTAVVAVTNAVSATPPPPPPPPKPK